MAYKGKVIRNSKTGQEIKFLQTSADTNGQLLEMQTVYPSFSSEPPPHYHPKQFEEFTVEEGALSVRIHGSVQIVKAGEQLLVPANSTHSMWNASKSRCVVNWKVYPALTTEYFLETINGLTGDGKTDESGRPPILQVALLARKYASIFRLTKPSFLVQRIVFALLTPFAYLKGYKSSYKKYFL